ncbi:MAG: peptidase domain-containing ABC transporter [Magnetococcales bacterium]|nr:peptidase domain-containing ABC transporter [Magnetococcales bacterium]
MQSAFKSLLLVARQHGIELNLEQLQHEFATGEAEAGDKILVKAARKYNMQAKKVKFRWHNLAQMGKAFPAIARLKNGRCVVMTGFQAASKKNGTPEQVLIIDPTSPTPKVEKIQQSNFTALWDGQMVLVRRDYGLADDDQPFSFSWLVGGFLKQKGLMASLVLIAAILHVFALLPVIYIIIILDKVVNYQATSTLYVVTIGIVIAFIFNAILGYLRQYIILFATSRVDIRLNAKVFQKLLSLPMNFFQKRETANIVKTVQQTNTIRNTISGKYFAAILDSTALIIFIPILYHYNPLLCGIVVGFSLLIAANVIITARIQKKMLSRAVSADNMKQSILTNSISGIETLKSLAIEPIRNRNWESAIYQHTQANFEIGKINAISGQISGLFQQLMTVALLFVGVQLVFSGDLSAGVLIGVNMLGGRVTTPLVQLVTLRMDMDKLTNAVSSLEGVLNARAEPSKKVVTTDIAGGIRMKSVSFSYPNGKKALDDVSLVIKPRARVAIVGTPGSGQSTLIRLIQKLMKPESGTILLDDQDIRVMDPAKLRSSVAVVNENTMLFGGSIRDNICMPYPNATMPRVIWATKIVGLHDEVEQLPDGYETNLIEGGTNLTAGQRQKIAMARALIRNPKILILDGVLSHFDVEGVLDLKKQMPEIASGRTLILISKQLAPISEFDLILVMDKGKLMEWGNHKTLTAYNRLYAKLWRKELAIWQTTQAAKSGQQQSKPQQKAVAQQQAKPQQQNVPQQRAEAQQQAKPQQQNVQHQARPQQQAKPQQQNVQQQARTQQQNVPPPQQQLPKQQTAKNTPAPQVAKPKAPLVASTTSDVEVKKKV